MALTVPQAARRVGKNPETIRRWIWQGRLRSTKIGNQHFVEPADLDAAAGGPPGGARDASWDALFVAAAEAQRLMREHGDPPWGGAAEEIRAARESRP